MNLVIQILAVIGLLISIEAWRLSNKKGKVWCEIGKKFACGNVIRGKYAHLFGMRTVVFGPPFYILIIALAGVNALPLTLFFLFVALIVSAHLAYIQIKKIKQHCLLCWGIYVINVALIIITYLDAFVVLIP
tara:strand:+ start:84 stop:479 length:396 start_codon:yes stop_codon:yes gene_type:complete